MYQLDEIRYQNLPLKLKIGTLFVIEKFFADRKKNPYTL